MSNTTREIDALLELLQQALAAKHDEPRRLIRLHADRPTIFVGDIHGDKDAVESVLSRFPPPDHVIVFLGDILDRGPNSREALSAIAQQMLTSPSSIHLLMGNHEARGVSAFRPADFWNSLSQVHSELLAQQLSKLPLAAWYPGGLLAAHGGLPDLKSVEAINSVKLGSDAWRALTWGDWVCDDRQFTLQGSRPTFGPSEFERRCSHLGIRTLIRSHQPTAPTFLYEDRCLTLFTTSSYGSKPRQVAQCLPGRDVHTAQDLQLITI